MVSRRRCCSTKPLPLPRCVFAARSHSGAAEGGGGGCRPLVASRRATRGLRVAPPEPNGVGSDYEPPPPPPPPPSPPPPPPPPILAAAASAA